MHILRMTLEEYLSQATASDVARRAGVSHTTITRIARREVPASPATALAIERATDGLVTAAELLAAAVEVLRARERAA